MPWRKSSDDRQHADKRIRILSLLFSVCAALIILRLFDLQVLKHGFYEALAADEHELYQKLVPERGSVYVMENNDGKQALYPLVDNQKLTTVYGVPKEITDASGTAALIFGIIGLPDNVNFAEASARLFADIPTSTDPQLAAEIKATRKEQWQQEQNNAELEKIKKLLSKPNSMYARIRDRLSDQQTEALRALKLKGVGFQERDYRFYPEQGLGGHIFGFLNYRDDNPHGQYGLEGYYDEQLAGSYGEIKSEKDAWGNIIAFGESEFKEKKDGSDLILTLDRAVQYKACAELELSVKIHQAKGGSVVVMDPYTGAIIAMCGTPDYNPDKYYNVDDIDVYNNPAIFDAYEPGSTFKAVTMAAALDVGAVTPNTVYTDTGQADYGPYHIKNFDHQTYGKQTMTQVLEYSINTGVIYAMRQMGKDVFAKYVREFGFGETAGIGISKEMPGNIANLKRSGEIYAATATFGQGIMATTLQMASAYGALVNGGILMKPYLVSQIISNGQVASVKPQEVRRVIKPETSAKIKGMLVSVVENGHAQKARMPGYRIGGKTGTAQVAAENGGYGQEIDGSFIGFFPFSRPRFVIAVRVKEPRYGKLGETVAVPVFNGIAKFLVQYYNVPYDNPEDPALKK